MKAVSFDPKANNQRYRKGLTAEYVAALILMLKGYRLLRHRYKTRHGEIDLVMRRRGEVVFVEVKARDDLSTALQSVTPAMQKRITNAASHFISRNPSCRDHIIRFDLFAVRSLLCWRHIDNAWRPPA